VNHTAAPCGQAETINSIAGELYHSGRRGLQVARVANNSRCRQQLASITRPDSGHIGPQRRALLVAVALEDAHS